MSAAPTATPAASSAPRPRAAWRAVAVPSEHGGWAIAFEAGLLGLLVAPSAAGVALAVGAMVAFLVRTPVKTVLVDRWRHRSLPRTRLAAEIAAGELILLAVLGLLALRWSGWALLVPIAVATPLVATELWFDMRSRGRRLVPELCGAVGVAAVTASIVLADHRSARLAAGAWLVLAARSLATIPYVRLQIERLRHGTGKLAASDGAQLAGVAMATAGVVLDRRLVVGAVAICLLGALHAFWVRRPPVPAKTIGIRQAVIGVTVVAAIAAGVAWW